MMKPINNSNDKIQSYLKFNQRKKARVQDYIYILCVNYIVAKTGHWTGLLLFYTRTWHGKNNSQVQRLIGNITMKMKGDSDFKFTPS